MGVEILMDTRATCPGSSCRRGIPRLRQSRGATSRHRNLMPRSSDTAGIRLFALPRLCEQRIAGWTTCLSTTRPCASVVMSVRPRRRMKPANCFGDERLARRGGPLQMPGDPLRPGELPWKVKHAEPVFPRTAERDTLPALTG